MAEGNIYIDLSEDIEADLTNRYQGLCDDLASRLSAMYQELEGLCSETQYEPMVNVVNGTIDLFDTEIYGIADQVFTEWSNGEGSFSAVANKSEAGSEALATAQQIEQNIRDTFDNFWSSHPMGERIQLDTSRPKTKSEDFDELKEIYTKCSQDVESVSEDTINQISGEGNDNPTYNVIIPAVKAITEPMKNAFEQFGVKIDAAKEQSDLIRQHQDQSNQDAAETATNTAASAADIGETTLKMFQDV